jgi:hypothetical protein
MYRHQMDTRLKNGNEERIQKKRKRKYILVVFAVMCVSVCVYAARGYLYKLYMVIRARV